MTRPWWRLGALVAALFLAGGCYKATFARDVPAAGPVRTERASFFVFGLVGVHEIDVREHCPGGEVRIIRTGGNVGTGLVTVLTLGIYAPRKVWIQCGMADGRRAGGAHDGRGQR